MKEENIYSHRNGLIVLRHKLPDIYSEILEVLNFEDETELITLTEKWLRNSKTNKSSSPIYNQIIESRFIKLGWLNKPKIFADESYRSWKLDFGKQNKAAVEVAFNNSSYFPHILAKLEISAEKLHQIEKDIKAEVGILIVASKELKKSQNFDDSCATFKDVIRYLNAYDNMLTRPIVLFAIDAPKVFKIKDNESEQKAQDEAGVPKKDRVDRASIIYI